MPKQKAKKRLTLKEKLARARKADARRMSRMTEATAIQYLEDTTKFLEDGVVSYDGLIDIERIANQIADQINHRLSHSHDEEVE